MTLAAGGVADGPFSYNAQSATPDYGLAIATQFNINPDTKNQLQYNYITRDSEGIYTFVYKIPENLFPGKYTVVLETSISETREIRELIFYVKDKATSGPIKIIEKEIFENIGFLSSAEPHSLKVEEIVNISGVDNYFDGVKTVRSIENNYRFSVFVEDDIETQRTSVVPTGSVYRDKSSGPVVVAGQPPISGIGGLNPNFQPLQPFATNSVLLIGHADSSTLQINQLKRIQSLQDAIDALNGDTRSPLLRAVINCYGAGCQDIYIMISAPMSEYVEDYNNLNSPIASFVTTKQATPSTLSFYEKYYERLEDSYEIAKNFDFIDIVVPVGVSFIRCENVNFVRQLADFCSFFYTNSSTMVIGIIGSRTNGANIQDIETMSQKGYWNNFLKDEQSATPSYLASDGSVLDVGRHILLYYGEAVFNYPNMGLTFTSSIASAIAGQISNWPVYLGLNRKALKGGYSPVGVEMTSLQVARIHNNKINTMIKSNRTRRAIPFQILISDDKTLAKEGSSLANLPQVRLVAMIMNEVLSIASSSSGKFSHDIISERLTGMFKMLKASTPSIIKDYRFEMFADKRKRGNFYIEIDVVSPHTLKRINFGIVAGPGA